MKKHLLLIWIVVSLVSTVACAAQEPEANAELDEANQLLVQLDRNLNPESYESYRKLINIEPDGKRKEFVLYVRI